METLINKLDLVEDNFLKQYSKIRKIKYFDGTENVEKDYRTKDSLLFSDSGARVYDLINFDSVDSGVIIQDMKRSIEPMIKYKREKLEFLIKKAIDGWDQFSNKILMLEKRKSDIQELKDKMENIFANPFQETVNETKQETEKDLATKEFLEF